MTDDEYEKQEIKPLLIASDNSFMQKEESDLHLPPNQPKGYLLYFPIFVGHVSVRILPEEHYWSWGGATDATDFSYQEDINKYGQPIVIPLEQIERDSLPKIVEEINGLFKNNQRIPSKFQNLLYVLSFASISTAASYMINREFGLNNIPKLGEVPAEVTATLLALTLFALCLTLAYKMGWFDTKVKSTFKDKPYTISGIGGQNCVQAAKDIIGIAYSDSGSLAQVANSNILTPKGLAQETGRLCKETLSTKLAEYTDKAPYIAQNKGNSYHLTLEDIAEVIRAVEFSSNEKQDRQNILSLKQTLPGLSLVLAIDRMEQQGITARFQGSFSGEAEKVIQVARDLRNDLPNYLNGGSGTKEFQQKIKSLHLDCRRRLMNTGVVLFSSVAAATPAILASTNNLDKLPSLGSEATTIAGYGMIFLATALIASYVLARVSGARLPFSYASESLTKICEDFNADLQALNASFKKQDGFSPSEAEKAVPGDGKKDSSQRKRQKAPTYDEDQESSHDPTGAMLGSSFNNDDSSLNSGSFVISPSNL